MSTGVSDGYSLILCCCDISSSRTAMLLTIVTSALHRAFRQAHPSASREIIRSNDLPREIIHRLYHLPPFGMIASPGRTPTCDPTFMDICFGSQNRGFEHATVMSA